MWRNRQLLALFSSQLAVNTGFGLIVPILPFLALDLGAQAFQIGLLLSSYALMQFAAAPGWGWLADRIGRRPILIVGMLGLAAANAAVAVSTSFAMVLLARTAGGLMAAAVQPTSFAYVGDTIKEADRGKGMGFIATGMGVGFIIGPVLGGALIRFGMATPFLAAAGLSLLGAALAAAFLVEPTGVRAAARPAPRAGGNVGALLMSPIGLAVGLTFLISMADGGRQSTIALYAHDLFRLGGAEMGVIFTVMGITYVALQGTIVGPLIDRAGERQILLLGLPLSAAGFLLVLAARDFASLTAAVALQGAGMAFTFTSIPTLISKEAQGRQGVAMGLRSTSQGAGHILGPLVGGASYAVDPRLPYVIGALLLGVAFTAARVAFGGLPRAKVSPADVGGPR